MNEIIQIAGRCRLKGRGGRLLLGVVGSYRWRRGLLPLPDELRRCAAALGERFGAAADRIRLSNHT